MWVSKSNTCLYLSLESAKRATLRPRWAMPILWHTSRPLHSHWWYVDQAEMWQVSLQKNALVHSLHLWRNSLENIKVLCKTKRLKLKVIVINFLGRSAVLENTRSFEWYFIENTINTKYCYLSDTRNNGGKIQPTKKVPAQNIPQRKLNLMNVFFNWLIVQCQYVLISFYVYIIVERTQSCAWFYTQ